MTCSRLRFPGVPSGLVLDPELPTPNTRPQTTDGPLRPSTVSGYCPYLDPDLLVLFFRNRVGTLLDVTNMGTLFHGLFGLGWLVGGVFIVGGFIE